MERKLKKKIKIWILKIKKCWRAFWCEHLEGSKIWCFDLDSRISFKCRGTINALCIRLTNNTAGWGVRVCEKREEWGGGEKKKRRRREEKKKRRRREGEERRREEERSVRKKKKKTKNNQRNFSFSSPFLSSLSLLHSPLSSSHLPLSSITVKRTFTAWFIKPAPVIVHTVPPWTGPEEGNMENTAYGGP